MGAKTGASIFATYTTWVLGVIQKIAMTAMLCVALHQVKDRTLCVCVQLSHRLNSKLTRHSDSLFPSSLSPFPHFSVKPLNKHKYLTQTETILTAAESLHLCVEG